MIPTAERDIQRRLTEEFIAADIVILELSRPLKVTNGAGGFRKNGVQTVTSQRFRFIPSQDGATERLMADGRKVTPGYILMGEHSADMERFDEFELDGRRYQIVFINEKRDYETKGEVAYIGD